MFFYGLKDTKVKNGDPLTLTAKVTIGPSKIVPAVKWYDNICYELLRVCSVF